MFYEIVFKSLEGSNNFVMNVSKQSANVQLETVMGNVIIVSVNNASTEIRLMGTHFTIFSQLSPSFDSVYYRALIKVDFFRLTIRISF